MQYYFLETGSKFDRTLTAKTCPIYEKDSVANLHQQPNFEQTARLSVMDGVKSVVFRVPIFN